METEILKLAVDNLGVTGSILAVIFGTPPYLAWTYHKTRIAELKTSVEEQKSDKADYRSVISGNTEAITKMAGALESNTQTMRDLRNYIERGH